MPPMKGKFQLVGGFFKKITKFLHIIISLGIGLDLS